MGKQEKLCFKDTITLTSSCVMGYSSQKSDSQLFTSTEVICYKLGLKTPN